MEVGEGSKENFEFDGRVRTPQPADTIYKTATRHACCNAVYKTRMPVLSLMK